MEDQRGIKREHSSSPEGCPSSSDAKTLPPAPSGSPSEISSGRPCSPVFKQGGSFWKALMIDLFLSSDEENFIVNTSHDAEFAKKLFGDLNRDILGPPGDGKIIILDDSDEKRRHQMRRRPALNSWLLLLLSTRHQLPPPLPTMLLWGQKMIILMIRGPIRRPAMTMATEVALVRLRPLHRRPRC
jgi:hypothetical protein